MSNLVSSIFKIILGVLKRFVQWKQNIEHFKITPIVFIYFKKKMSDIGENYSWTGKAKSKATNDSRSWTKIR